MFLKHNSHPIAFSLTANADKQVDHHPIELNNGAEQSTVSRHPGSCIGTCDIPISQTFSWSWSCSPISCGHVSYPSSFCHGGRVRVGGRRVEEDNLVEGDNPVVVDILVGEDNPVVVDILVGEDNPVVVD
eukprot:Selendium_serpulae@DN3872_c0_g1_i1.p1